MNLPIVHIVLALVFAAHVIAFSLVGLRRRRRGQPWSRYVLLVVAFALLAVAQLGELAVARGWGVVSEQGLHVITWLARGLFALGLIMLALGLVRRRGRRRAPRT
jgi:hypothetical protein